MTSPFDNSSTRPGAPGTAAPHNRTNIGGKLGIWEWDIDTGAIRWTDSLYAMHGVDPAKFRPSLETFIPLVHADDLPRLQEAIRRSLEEGAAFETEFRIARPDGAITWVYTSATVQREKGRPIRMVGATLDTSSRREAEQASRRLAAIVESSEDAIVGKDLDSVINSWNQGAERLFGYSAAEVIGRSVTLLIPKERQSEEREIIARLRRGERIEHFETLRRRKDGTLVEVSLTISPVRDEAGRVIGASKIARDVGSRRAAEAALRASEERFRLLADHAPVGIFLSDEAGGCRFVNNEWCRLAGVDAAAAQGDGWLQAVHPQDRPAVLTGWRAAVASGEPSRAEFRFRHANGREVWIHGDAVQFRVGARILGYLGSCTDITAGKMAERHNGFLHEVSERLGNLATGHEVMQAAAAALGVHLGCDRIMFVQLRAEPDTGTITHEWHAPGVPPLAGRYPFGGMGSLLGGPRGQVPDVREHPLTQGRSGIVDTGIGSFMSATLWQDARRRLALVASGRRPRTWEPGEVDLVERMLSRVSGLVERAENVAALRESEKIYRAIGESIPYGVWVCDAEGRNLYASESFLNLVGLTQEECANEGWTRVLHPDEIAATTAAWLECARTGRAWEREHRFLGVDGCWHPVLARGVPIRDGSGRIVRWVGINLDIASFKATQATAEQRMLVLERLNTVSAQLVAERDVQKLVQLVTDAGREVSGAGFGAFFYNVQDAKGDSYMLYTLSGAPREAFEKFPMPRATGMFGPTFRGEGVIRVGDVLADARYGKNPPHRGMPPGHLPVRSYLAVPVVSRSGEVLGGLFFGHPEPNVFTEEAEKVVVALASQAAIALDNAKLYGALEKELEEQRRAEALLRESEARWRQLAEAMPNLVWSCNREGLLDFVSPQWTRYTGKDELELLGDGWAEVAHPEDIAPVTARWRTAFESGEPLDTEVRLRSAAGDYRWFKIRAVPIRDPRGEVIRWYGSNTDVEDVRRAEKAVRLSEQQLRLVADHAPILLAQVDREHRFKFVNQPYAERYRRAREDIIGRHVSDLTGREAYRVFRHHMDRALTGQRVEFEMEIPYETLGPKWVHVIYEPEQDAEGTVVGLIAVILDISARKRTEQELERARDEALAASRAKDDFLAALSHELRTPLSPVLLVASDAAADPLLPREVRENFEMIRANISLEARLIDDLLDLTRISRGMIRLERRTLDLHAVLHESLANLRGDLEAKRLLLSLELTADRHQVDGDPVRLQQVFWNILRNAVKFTGPDGRIHVSTRTTGNRLEVRVADTGLGMTSAEIGRAFDAFAQGDHADESHPFGGLGLGLAIAKRLVELHGGTIAAASEGRNCGSSFTVELPLAPSEAATREPQRPAVRPAPAADQRPAPRVLLVEDHVATRETVARLLARRQYEVIAVGSAAEARLAISGQEFDAFVSDVGLPDGNGYELMEEIRRLRPDMHGIAVSGYGMEDDLNRSRAAGFSAHLVKPVSITLLDEHLRRLLHRAETPALADPASSARVADGRNLGRAGLVPPAG